MRENAFCLEEIKTGLKAGIPADYICWFPNSIPIRLKRSDMMLESGRYSENEVLSFAALRIGFSMKSEE